MPKLEWFDVSFGKSRALVYPFSLGTRPNTASIRGGHQSTLEVSTNGLVFHSKIEAAQEEAEERLKAICQKVLSLLEGNDEA